MLALLCTLVLTAPPDEPSFNGKSQAEWAAILKEDALARKRRAAVIALGQMAADNKDAATKIVPILAKALRSDANPGVRTQLATVLGSQNPDLAPLFMADLAEVMRIEKDSGAKKEMASALGRFGKLARPAVVPLMDALKDPSPETRAAAATALAKLGSEAKQAITALVPLTKDADREVRLAAVFAVCRVEPENPALASAAVLAAMTADAKDDELVTVAVVGLGLLGDRSAEVVTAVGGQLKSANPALRQQAALALSKFGPAARGAEAQLVQAFKADAEKLIRSHALHALCVGYGTQADDLIPILTERLKADPDFEVRVAIAEELGALGAGGAKAIGALREAQKDPQVKVREAAIAAVKAIQKPVPKDKK